MSECMGVLLTRLGDVGVNALALAVLVLAGAIAYAATMRRG